MISLRNTWFSVGIAALLWFLMFSPWTAPLVNFWITMAVSGIILTLLALRLGSKHNTFSPRWPKQLLLGIAIATVLWGVFWIGDKLSQCMFSFAKPQINGIYSMKGDMPLYGIALLLLLVIGPAEEIFWRGFVQRNMEQRFGPWTGFISATLCYTLVHIWSFNFMLIAAAAACGFCWGILYRFRPQWLPALVISHSLWDVAAFVLFPF